MHAISCVIEYLLLLLAKHLFPVFAFIHSFLHLSISYYILVCIDAT